MDALIEDIRYDNADALAALIASGADVNTQNKDGTTPLHFACRIGSLDLVNALIAAGADVNAQNAMENTPLHYVCLADAVHLLQTLLEAGADPLIKNIFDQLPQDITANKEIKDLIKNFGLGGGRATKAVIAHE